ncbi:TolB protein [Syntrophus gentianae]|uniref:TolB protein n=1 Tax=Syntrophus gentianae TaxID=43775 RepID=A0A1H8AQ43_9BACT|nr:PD40 domain-containing protein [Syntrophus gentianae]SEM71909.1 TolB protein [Syntrophus gentianae]
MNAFGRIFPVRSGIPIEAESRITSSLQKRSLFTEVRRTCLFSLLMILATVVSIALMTGIAMAEDAAAETIAFVRQGDIWIAKVDSTGQRRLTDFGDCGGPALSADARQVAFFCRSEKDLYPDTGFGQIYLVETAGGKPRRMKFDGIPAAEHPGFSSDGKSLVFVGLSEVQKQGKEEEAQVYATMSISIADLQTGKIQSVLRHPGTMLDAGYIYSNPSFSPDGQLILWQESGSDVSGGFTVSDLKGKTLFQFPPQVTDPTPYWRPSLALDGQTVLCYTPTTSEASDDSIHLVDRKTGKTVDVTTGANPVFVRHGTAIVFERWVNRWSEKASSNLWILELKPGATPKQIIADASEPAGPVLKPAK